MFFPYYHFPRAHPAPVRVSTCCAAPVGFYDRRCRSCGRVLGFPSVSPPLRQAPTPDLTPQRRAVLWPTVASRDRSPHTTFT